MGFISALILVPLAGSLLLSLLPAKLGKGFIYVLIAVMAIVFGLTLVLYFGMEAVQGIQFEERTAWIRMQLGGVGQLAIDYHVGLDGLGMPMVLLSGIVLLIGAVASLEIQEKHKGYASLYLLLSATVMGCFVALDFFLFFLCFELMLLPMYFLIGIWGGVRREYAALKFLIYTLAGSVMVLLVMIGLYTATASPFWSGMDAEAFHAALRQGTLADGQLIHSFNIIEMTDPRNHIPGTWLTSGGIWAGWSFKALALLMLLIGFGIKLPAVPVHTWLPDAHVEAPTPISVVLAGVLLKVGGYGMMRIAAPIFPDEMLILAPWIAGFGVLSIIYGALIALGSHNLKRMIACSSISHMGFVLLGLAAMTHEGWTGAIYQMYSHGLISAMLFLVAGVVYSRTHELEIDRFKGLSQVMPRYGTLVAIAFFAALGLPGFSGFLAELFVFLGSFKSAVLPIWLPITALIGLVLTAAYFLWTYQRMFLGQYATNTAITKEQLPDLTTREWVLLASLAVLALVFGVFPSLLLDLITPFVQSYLPLR